MRSFEDDQQYFEPDPIFDLKPVKHNECRNYAIIFPQIENKYGFSILYTLDFLDEILW